MTGTADDGFRYNYTQILGDGEDVVTVMIYICGADLESMYGCGTWISTRYWNRISEATST